MTDLSPETVGKLSFPKRFARWLAGWCNFNMVMGFASAICGLIAADHDWKSATYIFGLIAGLNMGFGIAIHDIRALAGGDRS